jgi:hypothetical protein
MLSVASCCRPSFEEERKCVQPKRIEEYSSMVEIAVISLRLTFSPIVVTVVMRLEPHGTHL